jgi:hypothetical protein
MAQLAVVEHAQEVAKLAVKLAPLGPVNVRVEAPPAFVMSSNT